MNADKNNQGKGKKNMQNTGKSEYLMNLTFFIRVHSNRILLYDQHNTLYPLRMVDTARLKMKILWLSRQVYGDHEVLN